MVVVDQAFTVTLEKFGVTAQVAGNRKAPGKPAGTVIVAAAAKRVAQHQAKLLTIPFVQDLHIGAAHVITDIRIVIVCTLLGNTPPRSNNNRPTIAFEADLPHHTIPAARIADRTAHWTDDRHRSRASDHPSRIAGNWC